MNAVNQTDITYFVERKRPSKSRFVMDRLNRSLSSRYVQIYNLLVLSELNEFFSSSDGQIRKSASGRSHWWHYTSLNAWVKFLFVRHFCFYSLLAVHSLTVPNAYQNLQSILLSDPPNVRRISVLIHFSVAVFYYFAYKRTTLLLSNSRYHQDTEWIREQVRQRNWRWFGATLWFDSSLFQESVQMQQFSNHAWASSLDRRIEQQKLLHMNRFASMDTSLESPFWWLITNISTIKL